jgi:hypothetical protein
LIRPAASLLLLLLAFLALPFVSNASAADADAGVPDPLAPGPYAVKKVDYEAGTLLLNLATAGQTTTVPMRGSITYPQTSNPSRVIIFVHGRHSVCIGTPPSGTYTCPDATDPDGTPTSTDIRSYAGYDYMAENLASHGYAVMSIEANVTNFDNAYADAGATVRSQIIQASTRLLDRWNNGKGPVTDDPDTTVGLKLVGRLELSSGIGLMGHSRGGDAVTDFVTYNSALPSASRNSLSAVLALAPTYYSLNRFPKGTNYSVLLPACDGDVSTLQGAKYFENAKYAAGNDGYAKIQWYVQGTDHNFYNTTWTGDDFSTTTDPACSRGLATSARLLPSDQRRVGAGLMDSFLRRYVGNETAFDPVMTGEVTLPSTAAPLASGVKASEEVKTSYVGPAASRLDVLHPVATNDPTEGGTVQPDVDPTSNTTTPGGGAITATGLARFETCKPPSVPRRGVAAELSNYPNCPERAQDPVGTVPRLSAFGNRSIGVQYVVDWNGPATLNAALAASGTKDVSGFGALDLRVAVNRFDGRNPQGNEYTPESATQDFDVTLIDADGKRSTTSAAKWGTALEPSIGTTYRHITLNGLRIPMDAFTGEADLTKIASVEFGFGARVATGSIQLSDVMFQEKAKPKAPVVTPTTPPADVAPAEPTTPSPEGTLIGTPAQIGTPAPVVAAAKCEADVIAPTTKATSVSVKRSSILIVGKASDKGCTGVAGKAGGGTDRTFVTISRGAIGGKCKFVTAKGNLTKATDCDEPTAIYAKGKTAWSLKISKAKLTSGTYKVSVTTVDRSGNATAITARGGGGGLGPPAPAAVLATGPRRGPPRSARLRPPRVELLARRAHVDERGDAASAGLRRLRRFDAVQDRVAVAAVEPVEERLRSGDRGERLGEVVRHGRGAHRRVGRVQSTVLLGGVELVLPARRHAALGGERERPVAVDLRPQAPRCPRREPDQPEALVVVFEALRVDPAEAEGFVERLGVRAALDAGAGLREADPDAVGAVGVVLEPLAEGDRIVEERRLLDGRATLGLGGRGACRGPGVRHRDRVTRRARPTR